MMKWTKKSDVWAAFLSFMVVTGAPNANGHVSRIPSNTDPTFAQVLCNAKQVTLGQSGDRFVLVSDDKISLSQSPMFHNPRMQIVKWPTGSNLLNETADVQSSVKSVTSITETHIIGTTVFGSVFSLAFQNDNKWVRDSELTSAPPWAKGMFVRWPSQIYLPSGNQQNLSQTLLQDPSLDKDEGFQSIRETTGLVSRSVIGPDFMDIGSDVHGNLFWRKNYGSQVIPMPNMHRFIYTDISFANIHNNGLAIIGRGLYWPNPSERSHPSSTLPLYALPVVELGTGIVNFYASPSKVIAVTPSRRAEARRLQIEVDRWIERGWYLHSMTTSSAAKKTILLFRNINDKYGSQTVLDSAVVFVDESGTAGSRFVCSQQGSVAEDYQEPPTELTGPADPTVRSPSFLPVPAKGQVSWNPTRADISKVSTIPEAQNRNEYVEFSHDGHRIGLWITQVTSTPKGTIILIRGGPADTVLDRPTGQMEHQILRDGYRLLRVEYSGALNTGYDVGMRLGQNRNQAIRRDALAVQAFLRERRIERDQPIALVAESFGSGLGTELLKLDNMNIKKAVFVVPSGTWVNPYANSGREQSERGRRGQAVSDRLLYGAPTDKSGNAIDTWRQEIRRVACGDRRLVFIFGENDNVVRASHWMPECSGRTDFHVLSSANHQLDSDPRAIEILATHLSQLR
jgi:pimeloyl-ACP methyl ester carboxylesterase